MYPIARRPLAVRLRRILLRLVAVTAVVTLGAVPVRAQTDVLVPTTLQRTALSPAQASALSRVEARPTTARLSLVSVRTEALDAEAPVRFDLGGEVLVLPQTRRTQRSPESYSWVGHTPDYRTTANLVVRAGRVTGSLRTPEGLFRLHALGDGLHALIAVDETAFPPDHGEGYDALQRRAREARQRLDAPGPARSTRPAPTGATPSPQHPGARAALSDSLGVVIAYTPSARAEAGGTAAIEDLAQLAVDETNTAYAASGVLVRLKLVHLYETADDNAASFSTDLQDFTYEGTVDFGSGPVDVSKFDGIEALRDAHGGDLAALLRGSGTSCGLGWVNSSAATAFTVTAWDCATGNYSFGHEIGHNLGALHNTEESPELSPYSYGHGFTDTANGFRTIMGYNNAACPGGFCPRVQGFSTPDATVGGNPAGDEALRNVARVFNQRTNTVASFKGPAVSASLSTSGGSIEVDLAAGASTTASLSLANAGSGTLYAEAGARLVDGSGGSGTYTYATSDDVPALAAFVDIADTGTAIWDASDTNEAFSTVALPFTFPFFGTDVTEVRVSENGFLTVDSAFDEATRTPTAFPSALRPDGMIAPYWGNHFVWSGISSAVYYLDMGDGRFVVQWDNLYRFGYNGSDANTFQVILHGDGTIEFQYASMQGTGNDFTGVTVGLESADGTTGVLLDYLEGFVKDDFGVVFTPAASWLSVSSRAYHVVENGTPGSVAVAIDASGLGTGTYTGVLTLASNDPADPLTTVPVTLTVLGVDYALQDGYGWRMLAVPSTSATVEDLAAQNLVQGVPGFYESAAANLYVGYDGAGWVKPTSSTEGLASGRGFLWYLFDDDHDPAPADPTNSVGVALPMTIAFDGSEPAGDVEVAALHADGDGWNLLGNPFDAPLDVSGIEGWDGTATLASTVGQMWQCVPDGTPATECVGSYVTTSVAGGEVPVWQGVFFQASSPGTLVVPYAARGASPTRRAEPPLIAFELGAVDAERGLRRTDRAAVLYFSEDAAEGWDAYDAEKLTPLAYPYVALAFEGARGDERVLLAQNALPLGATEALSLPLGVDAAGIGGTATLSWPRATLPDGWRVHLTDRRTGTTIDLAEAERYTFEIDPAPTPGARAALAQPTAMRASLGTASEARFVLDVLPPAATSAGGDTGPSSFALEAAYPNPTAGPLTVGYALPGPSRVRLAVYDLLGREVAVLTDAQRGAGAWQATWDAEAAVAGVYVLRLETEHGVQTQKVTVARRGGRP